MGSGGRVTEQLDVELAAVPGELGGQAEEPKPEAAGLSRAPSSGEGRGPDRVQELVGDGTQGPQECIAVEVIDGGGPCSELAEFLDPLFDDSTPVVAAPGGEGVDGFDVGEQVSAHEDLVGVELEGVVVAYERMACLEREKTDAPHTAGGGPELMTGKDVLTLARATPGLLMVRKPLVGRELEQKTDIEVIEGPYHGSAEEALIETHGDGLDPHRAQAPHEVGDPRLGPRGGVGVAWAPTDAHTVVRLLNEGQKRVVCDGRPGFWGL